MLMMSKKQYKKGQIPLPRARNYVPLAEKNVFDVDFPMSNKPLKEPEVKHDTS